MFRENMVWEIDNKGFRGFERQVCKLEKRVKDTGGFLSAKHTLESLGWRQRQLTNVKVVIQSGYESSNNLPSYLLVFKSRVSESVQTRKAPKIC